MINKENIYRKIQNLLLNGKLSFHFNLASHTWLKTGGNADIFFIPEDVNDLRKFLKSIKNNLSFYVLGAGSNTLFRDFGFDGAVIKLSKNFDYIKFINDKEFKVGAATNCIKLARLLAKNCATGLEFFSGIPGSIGGAVIMNSGCYDNDISKILISIRAIDINQCIEREITRNEIELYYRGTNLSKDLIITSVKLKGKIKPKGMIEKIQNELIEKKKMSQPSQIKTCGSTFKNLSNDKKAWKLIKDSGCEDLREGDAVLSKKHCNFFVNNGKAKSIDIENLIKKVKKTVNEKTGVNLELEIKIIGE